MTTAALPDGLDADAIPDAGRILGWIQEVFDRGIRRPGYDADIWAETFIADRFRAFGLESVRLEPAEVIRWEPRRCSLRVTTSDGGERDLDAFPLPYGRPVEEIEVELVAYRSEDPDDVAGGAALVHAPLLEAPPATFAGAGSAPADTTARIHDPDGTFDGEMHLLPFTALVQEVTHRVEEAGAVAFVGSLRDYPGDSIDYFVPYTGESGAIPGVWVRGSDGDTSRPGAAPVEAGLGEFQPLTPARLLDTRPIGTTVDGQSQKGGLVAAGSTIKVQVRGRGGVSNTTTAVALNLTAVNASGVGYITMWPCDASMPTASNLNTIATVARANMAISRVATSGPDTGKVCIYASVSTHLVLDVNGYSRGSAYTAITPVRLVDSRTIGTTVDGASTGWGPLNPFSAYVISLAGRGGVPANVGGLVINITAAQPGGTGYVTVWDCIGAKPPVSHLNLQSGVNVANLAVTTTNGTGHICVSSSVSTHLIIDVVGSFTSSSLVQLPAPYRISDSRANGSTFDGLSKAYGPVAAGGTVKVEVATRQTYTGHTSVARTVILTVTAVNPAGNGYFTVWPCGQPMPLASNLNVKAGVNFANTVFMSVGDGNEVCIYTSTQTQLVVDFDGYYFY